MVFFIEGEKRERDSGGFSSLFFTNADNISAHELVWWDFQVQWGRALTNATGGVVVGTVTGTEVAIEIT